MLSPEPSRKIGPWIVLVALIGAGALVGCAPPATEHEENGADTTQAPADAPAVEDGAPIAFSGLGQEPGWMLDVVPGEQLRFSYDYGQAEVTTPVPAPTTEPGRTVYQATTDAHDLRVVITDAPCQDVMSGQAFPATVTVTLDGETYHGCGEPA